MLTPRLRMDFSAFADSQYVVPQFLKPRQASFGPAESWDFEVTEHLHRSIYEMGTSHGGWQLVGGAGTRESLLGGLFDVAAVAIAPDRSFALFAGKPTQKAVGLEDVVDIARAEVFSSVDLGDLEAIQAWEQALWRWDAATGGIVPLAKFGRVAAIDIAPLGTWAAVIEDIPGPGDGYVSKVSLPSGHREWSTPITKWVPPHVRVSPDERWIAMGGPAVVDARNGTVRSPRWSPVGANVCGEQVALPHWHPRRPDRLLCLGRRPDLRRAVHRYEIDLESGEMVAEGEIHGPMAALDTEAPRMLACDVDASGTYALVVSDLGVEDAAIEDTGGGALSWLNLDTCTLEWTNPMIDESFVRVLGSPRWTATGHASVVPATLSTWEELDAVPITDHSSSRMRAQRSSGFDQEFTHRGALAVNRMLGAQNDGEVQLATYLALLDLDTARELDQLDELRQQLLTVLLPIADGSDAHRPFAQRLAAQQILAVTNQPQTIEFWNDVLYE